MNAKQVREATMRSAEGVAESVIMRLVGRGAFLILIPLLVYIWKDFRYQQETDIREVKELIAERTGDRYTGSEAAKDWSIQASRDIRQDNDRQRVERRVDILQNWLRPSQ